MAADMRDRLASCTGFDWDEGNAPKLVARHRVSPAECEQAFFNEPLVIADDAAHSIEEQRWAVWGRTADGRALAVVFTLRGTESAQSRLGRSVDAMPKSKLKQIPRFASEAAEQEFWATADTTEYFDWSKARRAVFPNLKPTTTPISVRLPETLLLELKRLANERDVPYQSLMKVYLAERVALERGRRRGKARP